MTTSINYRLNCVYPQKNLEWCQTFTQALMCPRDKNFVEVDEKIYWVQDVIHPLLSHSAQRKYINKKNDQKNLRFCLGYTCLPKKFQAISTQVEYACFTEVHVPFHRTMTIHIGYQGFCDSYAFRCHIGLKLFLRLAHPMGEGNTNFGIFQRWFATF